MTEPAAKSRAMRSPRAVQRAPVKTPEPAATTHAGASELMQRAPPALGLGIQRQVAVGEPGDRFEREADNVADRISGGQSVDANEISPVTPDNLAQSATAETTPGKQPDVAEQKPETKADARPDTTMVQQKGSGPGSADQIRETGTVQKAEALPEKTPEAAPETTQAVTPGATSVDKKPVQMEADGGASSAPSMSAVATNAVASKGMGKPLEPGTRGTLESGFGTGLGQVRVHDDAAAQSAARALNARAFTHGNDIWLGPGASQSDTRLMAHEATHVVQQSGGAHRMVQRANGGGNNPPPATTAAPPAAAPGAPAAPAAAAPGANTPPLTSPAGTIGPGNTMVLPLLKIPRFKADFLEKKQDVTVRQGERNTSQREKWLKELGGPVADAAAKKIAALPGGVPKPGAAAGTPPAGTDGKGDQNRVFFYRLGEGKNNLLIGTPDELKDEFVIPRWDKDGTPRAMDIDHKQEWQLGGPDETDNMQVLDAKANRSAGSVISSQIRQAMAAAIKPHVGTPAFPKMPTAKEVSALKATYTVTFQQIEGVDGLDSKNPLADKNAHWEKGQVTAVEDPFKALKPLSPAEIAALGGGPDKLVLFPLESGGVRKVIPWQANLKGKQAGKLGGLGFRGLSNDTIKYDNDKKEGCITGTFTPKKPKSLGPTPIELPLLGIPDLEYTARMQKGGLLASMKHAELYAFSPIDFYEAYLDEKQGIIAHGRFVPSLQIFRKLPIEIAVEGDDVLLEATITKDGLKLPGPIQITEGALTLGLGTSGPEVSGTLALTIQRLGEGTLGAKYGPGGLELHGTFDFDKKVFDNARIELHYVNDVLSGSGQINIPAGKVRGIKSATVTASFTQDQFAASGSVKPDIPAVEEAALAIDYGKETGLKFTGDLAVKADTPGIAGGSIHIEAMKPPAAEEFKVKGSGKAKPKVPGFDTELAVTYDDGTFDASITAAYEKGRLKGSILVGATNRPVADGQPGGAAGPQAKDITIYGGGSLTIVIAPWLQGTVGVRLLPNGEIELAGEIALPATLNVFPEKKLDKNIFTIGIDIPIVGVAVAGQRIGIFANISGGLDVSAGIGPGELQELKLGITYNPAHEESTHVTGGAKLHVPAHAGLRLFVRGGIGAGIPIVSAEAGLEIGAGLGLEGALDTGVTVDWTPTQGLVLDALAEIYVEPKLKVDLTGFVKVEADLFVTTVDLYDQRWQLAGFEYGSGLRFGVSFPVHYQEGQDFNLSLDQVKFQVPDIDPKSMLTDLISRL
jgi:hypothetical protein